jgi:hypothetical protein
MPLAALFDDQSRAAEQRRVASSDEDLVKVLTAGVRDPTTAAWRTIQALSDPERIQAYVSPLLRMPSVGFRCAR